MINSRLSESIDPRAVGKHMPRERYQRGSLSKIGKRTKVWQGLWHVYVRQPDGTEKRLPRTKVLGPATMSRGQAQQLLDELIATSEVVQHSAGSLTRYSKFEEGGSATAI
jgi:hypothetical protein